jgi:hypothetical protein
METVYDDYEKIHLWLENQHKCHVICVSRKAYVWKKYKQARVSDIVRILSDSSWFEASCGDGSKGVVYTGALQNSFRASPSTVLERLSYMHITFTCLALALLTVLSCDSLDKYDH